MQVTISAFHETETCAWCEKQTEAVAVEFHGGFLQECPLCWKCLQQAVRVQHRQASSGASRRQDASTGK